MGNEESRTGASYKSNNSSGLPAAGRKRDDGRAVGWITRAVTDACPSASLERRTRRPRKQRLTTWNRRAFGETKSGTLLLLLLLLLLLFSVALTLCAVTETYLLRARYVGR